MKLEVWAARPLRRIFRDSRPRPEELGRPLYLSCVRGEYEGCMFGVRAEEALRRVRLRVGELVRGDGARLAGCASAHFVGSIPLSRNTPHTPAEELERVAPCEIPDPILDAEEVDVGAGETQPCYFSIYVDPGAAPGDYSGCIVVEADGLRAELPVLVRVHPVTLPNRRSLYVTNWFSVNHIAEAYGVKPWSEEFWPVLEKWVEFMARYRQNVFWVPLETVRVLRRGDGFEFDFGVFDRYVEILLRHGAELLEITHLAHFRQWGVRELVFRDFDVVESDGSTTRAPGLSVIPHLLPALERHLEEKGWLQRALIHVADEPTEEGLEEWVKASQLIRRHAPRLRRIDAVETVGFGDSLEVWVPTLHHFNQWMDSYVQARERGAELWFYTCLNPTGRYPNRFIDYPLLKTRVLHWINYMYGLKGFLHWGFNWWGKNPFGEPSPNLPPGDTHISYPGVNGPLPSLRLEAMRDGLEDYELLKLLEEEIRRVKAELGGRALELPFERRALELCGRVVPGITSYVRDPEELLAVREEVIREIEEVGRRPRALVLTEPPEHVELELGPVMVIVRGVCEAGSRVEVNGREVELRGNYFSTYVGLAQEPYNEVVVRVAKDGAEKVIKRRFRIGQRPHGPAGCAGGA